MTQVRRVALDAKERHIQAQLLDMGEGARGSVLQALGILERLDRPGAVALIQGDQRLNEQMRAIERQCLVALASQQPVAGDLRHILTALHMAQERERIADHAADIGKIVLELESALLAAELLPLPRMAEDCAGMLAQVLAAYQAADVAAARAAAAWDGAVDAQEDALMQHLLGRIRSDPAAAARCTRLLWIGHGLGRIGDPVTNIAERVVFMVTGETPELEAHP